MYEECTCPVCTGTYEPDLVDEFVDELEADQ